MAHADDFRSLKRSVRNLTSDARGESIDVRDALNVLNSILERGPKGGYKLSETGQRARRISVEKFRNQISDFIKKSDRLFDADKKLSGNPDWASVTTPAQLIAYEKRFREISKPGVSRFESLKEQYGEKGAVQILKVEKRMRNMNKRIAQASAYTQYSKTYWQSLRDTYGSNASSVFGSELHDEYERIANPEAYKKRKRIEKWGIAGAATLDQADTEAARRRGEKTLASRRASRRFNHWYDSLSAYDREMFDLTQHYGGGAEGRQYAEEEMQRREKKERREAESRGSVRNRKDRLQAMRDYPMFAGFFKDSKNSAKDVRDMAKTLKRMSKIPFVGKLTHMTSGGAAMSIGTSLMAMMSGYFSKKNAANQEAVNWQNIAGVWGKPSEDFKEAAKDAGLKGEQIDKAWGKFQSLGGVDAFRGIGGMAPGMGKGFVAQALGFNEDEMRILDKMSGAKSGAFRKENAAKNMLDVIGEKGLMEGTDSATKAQSLMYNIWGIGNIIKSIEAQGIAKTGVDSFVSKRKLRGYKAIENLIYATDAAERDARYESQRVNNLDAATGSSVDSHNIQQNITNNIYTSDTADGIRDGVQRGADEARAVMEAFDPKAR